ncbi:MAG: M23 family metallopeptidase [Clostridiales bacterium]|nr:M23 family metallopeptidase [Clostridiales bacterium]
MRAFLKQTSGRAFCALAAVILLFGAFFTSERHNAGFAEAANSPAEDTTPAQQEKEYIKWVDFSIPYPALESALNYDIETFGSENHASWIDVLTCLACLNWGNWKNYKSSQFANLKEKLGSGKTPFEICGDNKYYSFYQEAYTAVLGGMVGSFTKEAPDASAESGKKIISKYGLMAYSPIAEGYYYSHSDDFGNARTYGYRRTHLGNDLISSVGTPVVAVEGGIVEAYGWNQYGGWRLGIRSFDGKRSYYYAHLRKNHPYAQGIQQGATVKGGQVIGYLGMTGYSTKENVNNMTTPHLHIGMQLIFDESQKEGTNQIWIDMYNIVRLLYRNRATVARDEKTGDYYRVYDIFYED